MATRLTRRQFGATFAAAALQTRKHRPNIIVNVMDDQRFDNLSCFEGETNLDFMQTPNMDRLAAEGVRFNQAFVTYSLCSPSRATMLTGKDVRSHGVNQLAATIRPDCAIFPGMLKQAGYETGFAGKWHIGANSELPRPEFDYWAGVRGQGRYVNPLMNINGSETEVPGYATDVFMDQALEFVTRKRNQPFFLWIGQKAPHSPCTPPEHLANRWEDLEVAKPATYGEDHSDKPGWFVEQHDHDYFHQLLHPNEAYQKYVKNFCRTIKSADENLGRLLGALDERGLTEDTVVIHISDNGHFLGEHQLYSKMLMYEESIRVPLIVRYPGMAPGRRVCEDMVLNLDLAPTVLDLAGVDFPGDMEGRSFGRQVKGETATEWRQSYRYEYYNSRWGLPDFDGVRTADGWMYCRFPDWEQMYNIREDPTEVRNLAFDTGHTRKKSELRGELRRLGGGVRRLRGASEYKRRTGERHVAHPEGFAQ
jgi:N-acetylglucosamine-6-sulfatase